jgi:uncharacterized membrane protein
MHTNQGAVMGMLLWHLSIILNWVSTIDKSTVSFFLGAIVSVMAIVHYFLQIRKALKKEKEDE